MALKILHLSTYDTNGGAARAAYSLHRGMLEEGLASEMWVGRKESDDPTVRSVGGRKIRVTSTLDRQLWKLQRSTVETWRSPARFGALTAEAVNRSDVDIVNLHWITDGFLSIEEIGKIKKPVVWSMYDMWPFAGTEHYGVDCPKPRWQTGYTRANRPTSESRLDIDRWTFNRKQTHWSTITASATFVPSSTWLSSAAQQSWLMSTSEIVHIPQVVQTSVLFPVEPGAARHSLGLPQDVPLLLFLSSAGVTDKRKGWDLLARALPTVVEKDRDATVVVVGPAPSPEVQERARETNANIIWFGSASSSDELRLLYSAADLTVVPSREDNLPLTAMEAQSCGCPVVAFGVGGVPDLIVEGVTGMVVDPGDVHALAQAITRILQSWRMEARTRENARAHAMHTWSSSVIVPRYVQLYEAIGARYAHP